MFNCYLNMVIEINFQKENVFIFRRLMSTKVFADEEILIPDFTESQHENNNLLYFLIGS